MDHCLLTEPETSQVRCVVVSDDEWLRRGLSDGIRSTPRLELVDGLDHQAALARGDRWADADVVIAEAVGVGDGFDRYSGVKVVQRIRQHQERHVRIIMLIEDSNDLLRKRLSEAGVDCCYRRGEIASVDSLVDAVNRPDERCRPDHLDTMALARLGVTRSSRINDGLDYIQASGLEGSIFLGPARSGPNLSRRRAISARANFARIARVAPVPTGSGAVVERTLPSWRQLVEIVDRARGADLNPTALSGAR